MSKGYRISVAQRLKHLNDILNNGECIPYKEYRSIVGNKWFPVLREMIRKNDMHIYSIRINNERCIYKKVMR